MMSLRGFEKVRGEFSLMCLVHNIKKITKKVIEGSVSWIRRKAAEAAQSGDWLQGMMLVAVQV
jgi:hypothetical protein